MVEVAITGWLIVAGILCGVGHILWWLGYFEHL